MKMAEAEDYWKPRKSLRPVTSQLLEIATELELAAKAHVAGNTDEATRRFKDTNTQFVRDQIEVMWGSPKLYPEQLHILRRRVVDTLPERLPKAKDRMPSAAVKRQLIVRDGYHCRFCELPVIPVEVRKKLHSQYPEAIPWGSRNTEQHAAFQLFWLQYDHVIPATFEGDSSLENMVITCAGCNFAKWHFHLAELGLEDPRERQPIESDWDGLMFVFDERDR